jgi:hypothetical protein
VGISYGSAQTVLTEELQMRWACAVFVLWLQTVIKWSALR